MSGDPLFNLGVRTTSARRAPRRPATAQAPLDFDLYSKLCNISLSNPPPIWFILPPRCTRDMSLYNSLTVLPKYGYKAAIEHLETLKLKNDHIIFTPSVLVATIPDTAGFLKKSPEFFKEFRKLIVQNQQFRWKMKRLIHRWRVLRLRQINTTDIATMEEPKDPIYLYDWSEKCKYIFEVKTILMDVLEKLQYAVELFPKPVNPRNPFTNRPLTLGQIHFLLQEIQRRGQSHWILGAFREGKYSLLFLQTVYFNPLKVNALKRIFKNPTDDICVDIVYDFILAEYEYHKTPSVSIRMWSWYLENRPNLPQIVSWRELSYKYYYSRFTNPESMHPNIEKEIHIKSKKLTRNCLKEMIEEYKRTEGPAAPVSILPIISADESVIEAVQYLIYFAELGNLSNPIQTNNL